MQLPARVPFGATIDRQIAICRRYESPLAVLCFGIDNLTALEQQHGQIIEHQVLCSAWARLTAGLREQDVSFHTGRGEFGVAVRNALAPIAAVIAARITALLCEPYRVNDLEIRITFSAGYAVFAQGSTDDGSALAAAATQARLDGCATAPTMRATDRLSRRHS